MSSQNWIDYCSWCREKISERLYEAFCAVDYKNEFECECPFCHKMLTVEVEAIPSFGVSKKEK